MRLPAIGSFSVVRWLALITLIVFASQLLVIVVLWRGQGDNAGFRLPLPSRAAAIVDLVDAADASQREELMRALSSSDFHVRIEPELVEADLRGGIRTSAFKRAMSLYTDALEGRRVVGMVGAGRWRFEEPVQTGEGMKARYPMRLLVELKDGNWLVLETPSLVEARMRRTPIGLFAGLFGLLVATVALLGIWRTLRPVREMALAARAFADSGVPHLVQPRGGGELRDLLVAFNDLQTRVSRLLENRALMMSAMSHDVRTYLTRLRLRIETLEPPSRAAAEKTIEDIQTLLGDSLAFAEADAVNFAGQRIDLAGILEKIAGSDQFTSDSVHLEIVARPTILGEASRLERAFVNLISNAIKYGEIAHVRLSEHASHAVVEISDKGPGIPVPLRERVFEPFFRMEGSRNRRVEGAGLGLAIARRLVERHGGVIELGAAPSGGLIVRVLLPRPHPR